MKTGFSFTTGPLAKASVKTDGRVEIIGHLPSSVSGISSI